MTVDEARQQVADEILGGHAIKLAPRIDAALDALVAAVRADERRKVLWELVGKVYNRAERDAQTPAG